MLKSLKKYLILISCFILILSLSCNRHNRSPFIVFHNLDSLIKVVDSITLEKNYPVATFEINDSLKSLLYNDSIISKVNYIRNDELSKGYEKSGIQTIKILNYDKENYEIIIGTLTLRSSIYNYPFSFYYIDNKNPILVYYDSINYMINNDIPMELDIYGKLYLQDDLTVRMLIEENKDTLFELSNDIALYGSNPWYYKKTNQKYIFKQITVRDPDKAPFYYGKLKIKYDIIDTIFK